MTWRARLFGLSVLLFCSAAGAARAADAETQARTYFNIGAKAYQAGKYDEAVQAFQEAYKKAPRTGLLFSMAQAHRMQYFASNDPAHLKSAIHYYRDYLKKDPRGARVGDSQQALATLVPILEKLEGEGAAETMSAPAQAAPSKPRLMINSPQSGVSISFDGRAAGELPFVHEVAPGKHRFTLRKPGYEDYSREIVVDPRTGVPPLDVTLTEKPARLRIVAPEGSDISIDGRPQGEAPLPPIELAPGHHFVSVTMNGKEPYTRELEVARGERRTLRAELDSTGQRTTAWILMGVGAGGVVAGGVLAFAALGKQKDAEAILDQADSTGNLPSERLEEYRDLKNERDDLRFASLITAGVGAAVAATGFVLFTFDSPRVRVPARDEKRAPEPGPAPSAAPTMEVSAAPLWAPGFGGASLRGRF